MKVRSKILYWRDSRFPSLYEEPWGMEGVKKTIAHMKELVNTAVVEYELVHEGFVQPYLKLLDALEKLTEALFELCPDAVTRFELTRENGIRMLFKTKRSHEGKIFTMIEIGWIYANGVNGAVEERLTGASAVLQQMTQAA